MIKLYRHPELRNPYLIAAWPGMGHVALGAVSYLAQQLRVQVLGHIKADEFFHPSGVLFTNHIIEVPKRPQNVFYYWRNPAASHDLMIFLGTSQPTTEKEYQFANVVLDVAKQFHVQRIYTSAAAPTHMRHTQTPRVFAVATAEVLLKELKQYQVELMGDGSIGGMNGLLLGVAKERNIPGICLLGEIPVYTVQLENPKSSKAVLEVLTRMLGLRIDFSDLDQLAQKKEQELEIFLERLARAEEAEGEEFDSDREHFLTGRADKIPRAARSKIERLFRIAEQDGSETSRMRLKAELDKWGVFEEYLDRFLDLYKKRNH